MRRGIALLLALLSTAAVSAQVDDPLYPLDVGSVWEFELSSQSMVYNRYPSFYRRERREVVGDTVLAGEPYRVVRVLTAAGNAATWTPQARCAVRVDRTDDVPVIEWAAVTGTCAPREQGMALSGAESGAFAVAVVGDTVTFPVRIQSGGLRLAEGIGLYYDYVSPSVDGFLSTVLTYVNTGGIEAGRRYEPGWWHDLVRLNEGDRYQYEKYSYRFYVGTTTFEDWVVRGDSIVNGTTVVLVEQNEYAGQDRALTRRSLCGMTKEAGGVSTVTLQGACTGIQTGGIWWFSHLRTVEALGGARPGSYNHSGSYNNYNLSTFADGIGYALDERVSNPGTIGAASRYTFTLRYAEIDGVTYGSRVVADESEPMAVGSGPAVRAYPNPFGSALSIDVAGTRPAMAEVEVLDVIGRRVFRTAVAAPGTHRLDLSALPPGMYVVRAALEDGSVLTQRVTKVR